MRLQARHPAEVTAASLAAAGLEVGAAAFGTDAAAALGAVLAGLTSRAAADRLNGARVAAVPARRVSSVVRDPQLMLSEFVHVRTAADGSAFVTPGRLAAFSRTPRSGPLASPGIGEHARDVLASAGLAGTDIDELIRSGVVAAGGPMLQSLPAAYR